MAQVGNESGLPQRACLKWATALLESVGSKIIVDRDATPGRRWVKAYLNRVPYPHVASVVLDDYGIWLYYSEPKMSAMGPVTGPQANICFEWEHPLVFDLIEERLRRCLAAWGDACK